MWFSIGNPPYYLTNFTSYGIIITVIFSTPHVTKTHATIIIKLESRPILNFHLFSFSEEPKERNEEEEYDRDDSDGDYSQSRERRPQK